MQMCNCIGRVSLAAQLFRQWCHFASLVKNIFFGSSPQHPNENKRKMHIIHTGSAYCDDRRKSGWRYLTESVRFLSNTQLARHRNNLDALSITWHLVGTYIMSTCWKNCHQKNVSPLLVLYSPLSLFLQRDSEKVEPCHNNIAEISPMPIQNWH